MELLKIIEDERFDKYREKLTLMLVDNKKISLSMKEKYEISKILIELKNEREKKRILSFNENILTKKNKMINYNIENDIKKIMNLRQKIF